jgi:arylsulfatase A-like enzyme
VLRAALAAMIALAAGACSNDAAEHGATRPPDAEAIASRAEPATHSPAAITPTDDRPASHGVLLLVCDTLRADRLSCYGYVRPTPGIDRLASLGTLFERNHSQGHWTLPSMISLMSGLYVHTESEALPADRPTLAEWLSESGVHTAAFVGNNVIGRERGFARGFDHFSIVEDPHTRFDVLVDEFVAWHAQHEREHPGEPWFVWLHAMDPHAPYTPEPKDALYVRETTRPSGQRLETLWRAAAPLVESAGAGQGEQLPVAEAMRRMVRHSNAYDGEVVAIDRGVARVLDHLTTNGGLAAVNVLFAADHGEMLYEYEEYPIELAKKRNKKGGLANGLVDWFAAGHENWFYPELWRTPLIAVGPGFAAGERRRTLSANLDLFPTIVDLFGVEAPPELDGEPLFSDTSREYVFGHGRKTTAVLERGGLQLVDLEAGRYVAEPTQLLFDRRRVHLTDVGPQRPEDVARLAQALETWRAERRFVPNMNVPDDLGSALRRLGYAALDDEEDSDDTEEGGAQDTPPPPPDDENEDER